MFERAVYNVTSRKSIETDIRVESKDILTLGEALEVEDGMLRWFVSDNMIALKLVFDIPGLIDFEIMVRNFIHT
jgi:hypothetical protein